MKSAAAVLSAAALVSSLAVALRAPAAAPTVGAGPYLGEIVLFAGHFAPHGWAKCQGQVLPIAQNQALFSILGTTYGGDGETTFALPDLRGRAPIGHGTGPGLTPYSIGQKGGFETVNLSTGQIPSHSHLLVGQLEPGDSGMPLGRTMASTDKHRLFGSVANAPMATGAVAPTGGGGSHENRPPHIAMNYIIALQGIFPTPD